MVPERLLYINLDSNSQVCPYKLSQALAQTAHRNKLALSWSARSDCKTGRQQLEVLSTHHMAWSYTHQFNSRTELMFESASLQTELCPTSILRNIPENVNVSTHAMQSTILKNVTHIYGRKRDCGSKLHVLQSSLS